MKEAVFIILVIAVLFAVTAVRYRRQIVAFINFYKQLKTVRTNIQASGTAVRQPESKGIQLVKCIRCGKFVPETETVVNSSAQPVCSSSCAVTRAA